MNTVTINSDNQEYFQPLFASRAYAALSEPNVLGLGAVDDEGLTTGALAVRLRPGDVAELFWLFVTEECRRQGNAAALLGTLAGALAHQGFRMLSCMTGVQETEETLRPFLENQGFFITASFGDLVCVPLELFVNKFKAAGGRPGRCQPLSQIPRRYVNRMLQQLKEKEAGRQSLLLQELKDSDLHPCSCGILSGEELTETALFLPRREDGGLILVYLQAAKPERIAQLLSAAAQSAAVSCPAGSLLTVATMNGLGRQFQKAFGSAAKPCPETVWTLLIGSPERLGDVGKR